MGVTSLVSVIVPVYNVSPLLDRCLCSICAQTYRNLEIILVDDGSNDGSGQICDEWASRDGRVVSFHKGNGGLSDARNYGIERAKGDYLMFVDSDDYVSNKLVELLCNTVEENHVEIAICDPVHVFEDREAEFSFDDRVSIFSSHEAIKELLYQTSFLTSAWGKLYSKSCFSDLRFPVGVLFEDSALMYRLFETACTIAYSPSRLYAYCHRENSITTRKFDSDDLYIWEICKQMERHYASDPDMASAVCSYRMSAALRIYLNAPNRGFAESVEECERWIRDHMFQVMKDDRARLKTKLSLLLFCICKPLMRFVYAFVDRWS